MTILLRSKACGNTWESDATRLIFCVGTIPSYFSSPKTGWWCRFSRRYGCRQLQVCPDTTSGERVAVAMERRWPLKSCVSLAKSGEAGLRFTRRKLLHYRVSNRSTTSHALYQHDRVEQRDGREAVCQFMARVSLIKAS